MTRPARPAGRGFPRRWPRRLRYTRQTATALLFTVLAVPLAVLGFVASVVSMVVGAALSITPFGPWIIAAGTRAALGQGRLHRWLARRLLGLGTGAADRPTGPGQSGGAGLTDPVQSGGAGLTDPVQSGGAGHAAGTPRARGGGAAGRVLRWRRRALSDPAGWRAVAYLLVKPLVAVPAVFLAVLWPAYGALLTAYPVLHTWDGYLSIGGVRLDSPLQQAAVSVVGVGMLAVAPGAVWAAASGDRALIGALLGPGRLDQRVRELERSRAFAVSDAAERLGRIERDLHDGTQARLVALGMKLAMIEAAGDVERARELARTARADTRTAIVELREVVRGFHPPALADGLVAALATLVAENAVPTRLDAEVPASPAPEIEALVYFCTAELLTNVVRHSGARSAKVSVRTVGDRLRLRVRDDGRGGAGPGVGGGTGLLGMQRRVGTVDGVVTVESPPGSGTVVTIDVPLRMADGS